MQRLFLKVARNAAAGQGASSLKDPHPKGSAVDVPELCGSLYLIPKGPST